LVGWMTIAPEPRTDVVVRPAAALAARPRLFAALEQAFPARFVPWRAAGVVPGAPVVTIVERGALADDGAGDPGAGPAFTVFGAPRGAGEPEPSAVVLGDGPHVEASVRGITLHDRLAGPALVAGDGRDDVLAAAPDGPVWVRRRGDAPAHRVRAVLPELAEDEVLYALLSRRAIAAVALVHFLREHCGDAGRARRRPRAAFVFDDPNLRRRSYGYIDYRRLVEHADTHGYHVAMAMIPLDAGRAHRATAALFTGRADRISLVVHGNDHIHQELLGHDDAGRALAVAAQALRRVERFERRSGVRVDRIMMPPHGRCSEAMSRALAAVGFDALSAIHPLPWTAERPIAPPLAAWRPAEFVGGCAVIPRTPLTSTIADLALRAFLDHPMVVYGHHEDLAGGLEPLVEAAARVDRVGDVQWTSVGAIGRSNADQRLAGATLCVRPYSGVVSVDVPDGASELAVAEPEQAGDERVLTGWSLDGGPVRGFAETAPLTRGGGHEVRLHVADAVDPAAVPAPAWRPWPKLRRAGTELRDRALPLQRRLSARRS
jgi:hypothetical protein